MPALHIGDPVPDIAGITQDGARLALGEFRGRQPVVVFFYPKDGTAICTKEACAFRDAYEDFASAGAAVIGVSSDSQQSHQQFAAAHRLPFHLLSDEDGAWRRAFGVPKTLGVLAGRVTYVIDREGIVRHVFNSQFAAGRHVEEALEVVRKLAAVPGRNE
jgi:peroxiredoxin Q/BCP